MEALDGVDALGELGPSADPLERQLPTRDRYFGELRREPADPGETLLPARRRYFELRREHKALQRRCRETWQTPAHAATFQEARALGNQLLSLRWNLIQNGDPEVRAEARREQLATERLGREMRSGVWDLDDRRADRLRALAACRRGVHPPASRRLRPRPRARRTRRGTRAGPARPGGDEPPPDDRVLDVARAPA